MPDHYRLSILHVSDLHARSLDVSDLPERSREKRRRQVEREAASRARVLGEAWEENLRKLYPSGKPDLVCFTGDVADWGLRAEYVTAQAFVDGLMSVLGVERGQLYVVPGNHDVQRHVSKAQWRRLRALLAERPREISDWLAGAEAPKGVTDNVANAVARRTATFWEWVEHGLGRPELHPARNPHRRLGYSHVAVVGLPFPVHVTGLDSAWMAGDDADTGKLWLTQHQRDRLLYDDGKKRSGFRIALMHHPLRDLADRAESRSTLAETVDLVLHGHQHDPEGSFWSDPDDKRLRVLAAGCLFEGAEQDAWRNGCHRIDVMLDGEGRPMRAEIHFRAWSPPPRGHWHADSSLYRRQPATGPMIWHAWDNDVEPSVPAPASASEPPRLRTTDTFVGRTNELEELRRLVDGPARIAITAIFGMPGVGKSFLAEHFAEQYFADRWHRISLSTSECPTGVELFSSLASRLRVDEQKLVAKLSDPRSLVIVDNVDAEQLVEAVVELGEHLRGVPLLVTGRYDQVGWGGHWGQVRLQEYATAEDALAQLAKEGVDITCDESSLREMVEALGRLPLALSLAAGHLRRRSYTCRGFVEELRRRGLGIQLAEPADPRRRKGADHARFVLSTSFEISWNHLRDELQRMEHTLEEVNEMLRGLANLGHGPAGSMGSELAFAITGLDDSSARKVLAAATRLSLLRDVSTAASHWEAWGVHPLIAEFLRGRAELGVEANIVQGRVSAWFLGKLREASSSAGRQAGVRTQLRQEGEALEGWLRGLRGREAYVAIETGFDFARSCGPYPQWMHVTEQADTSELEPVEQSNRLWWLAVLGRYAGQLDRAMDVAKQKAVLDETLGRPRDAAVAKGMIADILEDRGDLDQALLIREQDQLPAYQRLGDAREEASTLVKMAQIHRIRSDYDRALSILCDIVLPIFERLGVDDERAATLGRIADIQQARGNVEEALRIREQEELPVYERLGDIRERAITMGKIADIHFEQGNYDQALHIRQHVELPVYEHLGDTHLKASVMGGIADIYQRRGDFERALHIYRFDQLPTYERLGDVRGKAIAMGRIADILHKRGDLKQALHVRRHDELPVYERLGDNLAKAVTMGKIADILQDLGDLDEALRIREQEELPVYERSGDVRGKALAMGRIAGILKARGLVDEALRIRQHEELPVYERLGDSHGRAATLVNIAILRIQQADTFARSDATRLLTEAYQAFAQMKLPDADEVLKFAEKQGLTLELA